jgi:hypothetical protein
MNQRRSVWFTIGWVCLAPAWGLPLIGFLDLVTGGLVSLSLVVFFYGAPYCLLHYLLWGRRFSRTLR